MLETDAKYVKIGRQLAKTKPGDEIVVSGISGCFPSSDNVFQYYANLKNKVDTLIPTKDEWLAWNPMMTPRVGKIKHLEKFDAGFFGISAQQAEMMDPGCRKLLELSVSAVIDAGCNLKELRGSKTGVFVATNYQESEKGLIYGNCTLPNFAMTGCTRSMSANRISYHLGLEGPSVSLDSGCSGSFYAIDHAYRSIRAGTCASALVCGVHLVLNPNTTLQYAKLNLVSPSGQSGVFDESFNGFVRSEAISVVYLQKIKDARTVYAEVVHVKTNSDGYKSTSLLHPSCEMQVQLYNEIYNECGVDPSDVAFVECHAAGTEAGDLEEVKAVYKVFCQNRTGPLWIGSSKSNIGHTESTSGLCSLVKVLAGLENGHILPNINCVNPRKDIEAFGTKEVVVVTNNFPLKNECYIGINNFGFGGTNSHVVIKARSGKVNECYWKERLICISGRTENCVQSIIKHVVENFENNDYLILLNQIFRNHIDGFDHRGYIVISQKGRVLDSQCGKQQLHTLDLPESNCQQVFNNILTKTRKGADGLSETSILHMSFLKLIKSLKLPVECVKHLQSLMKVNNGSILSALGKLYLMGYNPKLEKLYPTVSWPVKAPMLSPLISWNHLEEWYVYTHQPPTTFGTCTYTYTLKKDDLDWTQFLDHIVDGQVLFPGCGYLYLAWLTFAKILNKPLSKTKVVCENLRFYKPILITEKTELTVSFKKLSTSFEIVDQHGELVASGKICLLGDEAWNVTFSDGSFPILAEGIYQLLRLTGYEYGKFFQGILKTNDTGTSGELAPKTNWATFFDAIMQTKLLKNLSDLVMPVTLDYFSIDPKPFDDFRFLAPVDCNLFKTSAVEVRGFMTMPVLNGTNNINLENLIEHKLEVIEVVDGDCSILSPVLKKVLRKQLLVESKVRVFNKTGLRLPDVDVEAKGMNDVQHKKAQVLMLHKICQTPMKLLQAFSLCDVVVSKELCNKDLSIEGVDILANYETDSERLVLLRKSRQHVPPTVVHVESHSVNFDWLPNLQKLLSNNKKVLLVADTKHYNGILGLVNCLKLDWSSARISCVFLMDRNFISLDEDLFQEQLRKDMFMNVLCEGEWGTYRHLPLVKNTVKSNRLSCLVKPGDLSSVCWVEGSCIQEQLVTVHYAALNFKDAMIASGALLLPNNNSLGFEFSGTDTNGTRIMGCTIDNALSNFITVKDALTWTVPDEWSLEDAATIPITYSTVIYALIILAQIKKSQSILIHAGAGGIGQSAINIALHFQCKVFVTVGSERKRKYLQRIYSNLPDNHIGNTRDESFEQTILKATNGKGVDIVLNSLTGPKLLSSLRCLSPKGTFLEIGKSDLLKNNPVPLELIEKRKSFGVQLDNILENSPNVRLQIRQALSDGIKLGYVKPLKRIVFNKNVVEDALRYLTTGRNIGKVLINMLQGTVEIKPKVNCNPNKVYVLIGGLGGLGLEFANWLVGRNAKTLVIVSRSGVKTEYQKLRIKMWTNSGVKIVLLTDDVSTKQRCLDLIAKCGELGPIEGIFNFAVVLKDGLLNNQTKENFKEVLAPKALVAENLDVVTRDACPELKYFVMCSSLTSGRGILGQTNYGMANSAMERVCEQRKRDGYPGLAIQWGPIADVGVVARTKKKDKIGGAISQRVQSCLEVMDIFMQQNEPIVATYVIDLKTEDKKLKNTILDDVKNILGIRDLEKITEKATLSELGMDSLASVGLKQAFETNHGIYISTNELQKTTIKRLKYLMQNHN